jgi:uncharacterized protein YeaO (DUF488 family)
MIKIKRVYAPSSAHDGKRILVDLLWPRGLKKEDAHIDEWMRELAPSKELRKWFAHDPQKWGEFRRRFFKELGAQLEAVERIAAFARKGTVTLLYGSREERFNNAAALKEFIEAGVKAHGRKKAA